MYELKPRAEWTLSDELDVAYLIVTPETNGGMDAGVDLLDVAGNLPADLPAWAVWVDGLIAFVVGLIPFDGTHGVLHLAGTRTLSHAEHVSVVRGFLASVPGVQVQTMTTSPALVRLARAVGLVAVGEEDGQWILGRASPHAPAVQGEGMNTATLFDLGGD